MNNLVDSATLRTKDYFLVAVLFFCLIVLATFPLAFNISRYIPGFFSTDESFGPLWESWRLGFSFHHHLPLRSTNLVAYPFGVNLYPSGYISYLWFILNSVLGIVTNPVFAYNIQVLTNLMFSGIFCYLLVYYISGSQTSAIFSGIIYVFCPYQLTRTWQHLGLTYNQWMPLIIFLAFRLREKDSKKNRVFFLVGIVLLSSFDWSVGFMTTIAVFSFFAYVLFYNWKTKFMWRKQRIDADFEYLKTAIFIGLVAFFIVLPQFFPAIKNRLFLPENVNASAFSLYRRDFNDIFVQSARPLSYFLPATSHPLLGKFTENFVGTQLYGDSFTEHAIYLGWLPLILAFVCVKRWQISRKLRTEENFYIGFFIFMAIVAYFFSQPPWWQFGRIRIYMPSFFMYKLLPMFRAYCRFGIVLMLAISVLAGFGLKLILGKLSKETIKVGITILFCVLVLFEFWNWPPYKVIDVSRVPAAYYWLKAEPGDFTIAEYPLDTNGSNELYKFFQTVHGKKIINGTIPGTYANKVALSIIKLSLPQTASALKWMGVKYIFVHRDSYLDSGLIEDREELDRIPLNPRLKLLKSFPVQGCPRDDIMCVQKTGPIDVYEVAAAPIEPRAEE
jgi:hypothetical protein